MTKSNTGTRYNSREAVARNKTEQSAYDMNDEELTKRSDPNSSRTITQFRREAPSLEMSSYSSEEQQEAFKLPGDSPSTGICDGCHAPCKTNSSDETSRGFETSNEKKIGEEVSWSYSEGSTYVSECVKRGKDALSSKGNRKKSSPGDFRENSQKEDALATLQRKRQSQFQNPPRYVSQNSDDRSAHIPTGSKTKKLAVPQLNSKQPKGGQDNEEDKASSCSHNRKDFLENVDYYSCLNTASNNDGLSVVRFISKEDTEAVFCRRLVPIEISVQKQRIRDSFSPISSLDVASLMAVGDESSEQAVCIQRGAVSENLSATKTKMPAKTKEGGTSVSAKCNDIVTGGRKIPHMYQSRQSILSLVNSDFAGEKVFCDNDMEVTFETTRHCFEHVSSSLTSSSESADFPVGADSSMYQYSDDVVGSRPSRHQENIEVVSVEENSIQKGGKSSTDRKREYKPSLISLGSSRVDRLNSCVEKPLTNLFSSKESKLDEISHHQSGTKESPTEARMRYLQERIRKMQVKSTMERLPDHNSKDDFLSSTSSKYQVELQKRVVVKTDVESTKRLKCIDRDQIMITGSAARQACLRDRIKELRSRVERQDIEDSEIIRPRSHILTARKLQLPQQRAGQDARKTLPIPSEVSETNAEDGVSTICCDLNESSLDEIDLEEGSLPVNNTATARKKMQDISDVWDKALDFLRKSKGKLDSFEWYKNIQAVILRLWMKYVHGKTRTEKSILGVLVLSSLVLVVLLMAIIAKS